MEDLVQELFGEYGYVASFSVLLLCGVGLPLPEEVTLIGSGMLVAAGTMEFVPAAAVCAAAILIGDSIPFWLGQRYGEAALKIRWVAKILHPERFARLRQAFRDHGNWATFSFRFVAGVRIPGYFVAGTMGMSYARFLLLDSLGVLISVPLSIWLGVVFSQSMEVLRQRIQDLHLVLGFLALSLVLILIVRTRSRRNRAEPEPDTAPAEDDDRTG